jgi:hypothetical protein
MLIAAPFIFFLLQENGIENISTMQEVLRQEDQRSKWPNT